MNKYEVEYISTDKMRCIVWAESEEDVRNLVWKDSDHHEYIIDINKEIVGIEKIND